MAFVLFKGIEWRRRLTVTDGGTTTRTDLTGKTIAVQLRRHTGEAAAIELTNGSGVTLLDQVTSPGLADVVIAADLSTDLEVGNYTIVVLLDGQVVLSPLKLPVRSL